MRDVHTSAKRHLGRLLLAALVIDPLGLGLSKDELQRAAIESGMSTAVFDEVIREFWEERASGPADETIKAGSIDLTLLGTMVSGHRFPSVFPMDTVPRLEAALTRLEQLLGVNSTKSLESILSECRDPPERVKLALGILLTHQHVERVGDGFRRRLHTGGSFGSNDPNHPESQALNVAIRIVQGVLAARATATISVSDEVVGGAADLDRRQSSGDYARTRMPTETPNPTKVFIIHGRNVAARNAVEQFVRCLGLEPLDFDQVSADLGGSVFVGEVVRRGLELAQGIIALFTPDEFSALRPALRPPTEKHDDVQRWQSRPNVIFEAGMAYGMSRERTVLVTLGTKVSLFSDVSGIHTVRLDNNVENRKKLRQKLIGMRCRVDERADAWTDPARSGDFESCLSGLREVSPQDPFADPKAAPPAPAGGPVRLSDDAARYMQRLARKYIDAGYPNHKVWQFDSGADTPVHSELQNGFGFIRLMGTRGAPYTLTDRGHAWIMAHGDELDSK